MSKKINRTVIKYFLSYLLIFLITVISLFMVYRSELIGTLTRQFEQNALSRLNNAASGIDEDIKRLHTLNTLITGNVDILLAKYSDVPARASNVRGELQKYIAGDNYVLGAVYIDKIKDRMYSYNKEHYLTYADGTITIHTKRGLFRFDPGEYNDSNADRLVYTEADGQYCLIYYPVNHSYYNYTSFFILDNRMLTDVCDSLETEAVSSCIITDGQHIFGSVDASLLLNGRDTDAAVVIEQADYSALCVSEEFAGGLRLCALTSGEELSKAIYAAWFDNLPIFLLIIALGLIIVLALTYFSYNPLSKLARKLRDADVTHKDPLQALDQTLTKQKLRSSDLEEKIEYYRTLIKKSVLDSLINASLSPEDRAPSFDYLFEPNSDCYLAVAACSAVDADSGAVFLAENMD
ncbi:MAG: hypothetical protein K5784_11700, partial [Clostridiales bacterium]|nr:hypothetical protein [Clostridiales bacterium]